MEKKLKFKSFKKFRWDIWSFCTIILLFLFGLFLCYPLFLLLKESVINSSGHFTLEQFGKIFSNKYYSITLLNSFLVSISVTVISLILGILFSYIYCFYKIKGAKLLFVLAVLCSMSPPFIGAYAWILLLGRTGTISVFFEEYLHITLPSIYGFNGILLVQSLKMFPLVFIYMIGAFRNIDASLLEASSSLGCTGIKRFFKVINGLSMPTILAASLLVFMRTFADFGTPLMIGEGYRTFPVEIYNQYLAETGSDKNFAAAFSVVAILVTAIVFLIQKYATSKFSFSMNALHPISRKKPTVGKAILMYIYQYLLVFIAFLPQVYIIYLSFRNFSGSVLKDGYSMNNYANAWKKGLMKSVGNTLMFGIFALAIIIILALIISYLNVRRKNIANKTIDTVSMLPYIMPGSVIGIAMIIAFSKKPFALTGTAVIMIIALVIRRLPYTTRSATATLMQIPMSIEEASISLGASKFKTFTRITAPMMSSGVISGAILSWVAIITELSSAIMLYSNKTITLTMQVYVAVSRGNDGLACAFASILLIFTSISLLIFLKLNKSEQISI